MRVLYAVVSYEDMGEFVQHVNEHLTNAPSDKISNITVIYQTNLRLTGETMYHAFIEGDLK